MNEEFLKSNMGNDSIVDSSVDYLKDGLEKFQKLSPGGHFTSGILLGLVMRSTSPIFFTLGLGAGVFAHQTYDLPAVKPYLERGANYAIDYLDSIKKK